MGATDENKCRRKFTMNELSTVEKLENMMKELMTINIGSAKRIEVIETDVKAVSDRMDNFERNAEVTTQQKNTLRRTVNRQICTLLNVNPKKYERSLEEQTIYEKYSSLFHRRCYSEVSRLGHLATPYECTTAQNFIQAIRDIEGWTPSNGIDGLKGEADRDAAARKSAREQGYK